MKQEPTQQTEGWEERFYTQFVQSGRDYESGEYDASLEYESISDIVSFIRAEIEAVRREQIEDLTELQAEVFKQSEEENGKLTMSLELFGLLLEQLKQKYLKD